MYGNHDTLKNIERPAKRVLVSPIKRSLIKRSYRLLNISNEKKNEK